MRTVLVVGAVIAIIGMIAVSRTSPLRTLLAVGAVVAIVCGVVLYSRVHEPATDFTINRVAAQRLLDREDLYDSNASRPPITEDLGGEQLPRGTYFEYIGLPTTALLYVPWAELGYTIARDSFRVVEALLMLAAVLITGLAVPRSRRAVVWVVGVAGLGFFFSVPWSIALGQADGFVMLALGVAIWASVRRRWYLLGAALGVAVLLKISPWLVLGFMLLRVGRNWGRVALGAMTAVGALVVASMVIGRAGDVGTWLTDIAPVLARGTRSVENVSIPAFIERLTTGSDNIVDTTIGLGSIRFLGYAFAIVATLGLWWWRRRTPFDPLELGLMIVIALACGPLTWVHYASWAVLALMLPADPARYDLKEVRSRIALAIVLGGAALMALPTKFWSPEQVAEHWWYRLYTGVGTAGLLLFAAAAMLLMTRQRSPAPTKGLTVT